MIKTLLSLIRQLYPLRTCSLNLSTENIKSGKYKVCLEYHIGNCLAPCVSQIDENRYNSWISDIRKIFNGDLHLIQKYLIELMKSNAKELKFEEASKIKAKIDIIENYRSKSKIVDTNISDTEVYGFAKDINSVYINYLRIQNGSVTGAHSIELKKKIDENDEDILSYAIFELRELMKSSAKYLILPFKIEYHIINTKTIYPKQGDKFKLLELAQRNAYFFMLEKHKQIEQKNPENHAKRKMETLKKDLNLSCLPEHIECFDNSNIQGTNPVAACVVFKMARHSKSDYRHYNIKTVTGPDDFASMTEVVYRRYKRLIDENENLPQLIIIDGGKGQLSAAVTALEQLNISEKVSIIGIAKRLEEIYFPGDSVPLYLDKNSESLKLIQQIRDEAHRFGIKFHRDKRSSGFTESELNMIKGIGSKTVEDLITKYKSVANIKKLGLEDISKTIGNSKAKLIFNYFHKKKG
jgi:excinuclease ABC subunit C